MTKDGATGCAEENPDISGNDLLVFRVADMQYDGQVDRVQCLIELMICIQYVEHVLVQI